MPRFRSDSFDPIKIAMGAEYLVFPDKAGIRDSTDMNGAWTAVGLPLSTSESAHSDAAYGNDVFVALVGGHIFRSNPVSGSAPVTIVTPPQSASVNVGVTVVLSVIAQGSDSITYQWRKNEHNIDSATDRTLTLSHVTVDDAGEYDVVVTNPAGSKTSDKAVVTVHFADVHFYAGVTLRGNVGDKFSVEYQDQLDPSGTWYPAASVTLSSQQTIWFDPDSAAHPNRFYRATFLGP